MNNFIQKINEVSIKEIALDIDEQVKKTFIEKLNRSNLFIIGETHGIKENAGIVYTLFKLFNFKTLALEWEENMKDIVDTYISTGEFKSADIDSDRLLDGRITAEDFALIKKLKEEGLLEEIIYFDPTLQEFDWNLRDKLMAQNIINSKRVSPTLVKTGNLHARSYNFTHKSTQGEITPMGRHLQISNSNTLFGRITYQSGQYYNFGIHDFDIKEESNEGSRAKFYELENTYIFQIPIAHSATILN